MILIANISASLEIANWIQVQLKNLENFQVCQQLDIAMFSKLFWEIGLRCGVVLLLDLVISYVILSMVKMV